MHLVMFDIDGTLTETTKVDEECFVRSFKDVFGFADLDTDWSHYPHTTDSGIFHDVFTSRIGRSPTRRTFRDFVSISSNCSLPLHHSLHLHRLQGLTGCCPGSHRAARIACRLLLEVGVIPPASRWPVPGCALTTIRRHQRMTPSTGRPLCGFPCREQPSDMADLAALFTLVTVFGMLVRVAAWAFRSLALARGVERHDCPRRVLFVSSLISVTRICFLWRVYEVTNAA